MAHWVGGGPAPPHFSTGNSTNEHSHSLLSILSIHILWFTNLAVKPDKKALSKDFKLLSTFARLRRKKRWHVDIKQFVLKWYLVSNEAPLLTWLNTALLYYIILEEKKRKFGTSRPTQSLKTGCRYSQLLYAEAGGPRLNCTTYFDHQC